MGDLGGGIVRGRALQHSAALCGYAFHVSFCIKHGDP